MNLKNALNVMIRKEEESIAKVVEKDITYLKELIIIQ